MANIIFVIKFPRYHPKQSGLIFTI